MSRQQRAAQNIALASVDDLFGLDGTEQPSPSSASTIVLLPVDELHTFRDHPFKVIPDDESMFELIESIREDGIIVALEVRPRSEGGYEIVSGHRRKFAARQAGLQTVPCSIITVDDDSAIKRMVDSNIYREKFLPSEKAFSYKMKLEAMNRQTGRPANNGGQVVHHLKGKKSRDIIAEQNGEKSGKQVSRYIRLTYLSVELLELVDAEKIAFNVGVTVSYLGEMQQIWLFEFVKNIGRSPLLEQAEKLKKYHSEHKLTKEVMEVILSEETGAGPTLSIKTKSIAKYFPPDTSKQEMEQTILKLLEYHMNGRTTA